FTTAGLPRLLLSEACPLILDYHVALDVAREKARGAKASELGKRTLCAWQCSAAAINCWRSLASSLSDARQSIGSAS
ncbi:hypothetical protein FK513_30915, partial [Klebsiella pneumoniae]|nr:hypothetical protein [Klebsiella pneumoniae]